MAIAKAENKPTITIADCLTDQEITREMTDEEIAQHFPNGIGVDKA